MNIFKIHNVLLITINPLIIKSDSIFVGLPGRLCIQLNNLALINESIYIIFKYIYFRVFKFFKE